jgi:hypothetical protein
MPIADGRWLREYHWQRERLWRWWTGLLHPVARKWGTEGQAIQAWVFDTWHRSGRLDILIDPQARILQWVRREALVRLWDQAAANPLAGVPLLGLATIEIMVRRLEASAGEPRAQGNSTAGQVVFEPVASERLTPRDCRMVGSGLT